MNDETDIDISSEPDASEDMIIESKPRKRFGGFALLGAMFLSSAFGAGLIGVISHFNKSSAPDFGPIRTKIESISAQAQTLAADNKTLKAQVARLQRDMKQASASVPLDIRPLEQRLKTLEEAKPNEIDPELLSRLEALQNEGSEALDLSDILARLEALENRPVASPVYLKPAAIVDVNDIINFPREAILESLEKPEGWLKKSLKKHISVQSDDNPRYLVEQISKHIESGDIDAAIAAFEKLPADAKDVGQAWRESLNR